ncbi:phage tail sheath family protein [Paenibacillus endoradicis]|uniref:phage tail sheath family protein n=1 Tax=Paenibacillus endoradicis TaxID=2972487 RepID=UPI002159219E|nr:phage tail sheath subtilisin-like domain-containing protein [Paenibacillus endoradicis]MCR8657452.1 phage tail sheath subtilisin-like domain-containing protein [Paenibacillus endoradicis]
MAEYFSPGVYVEEFDSAGQPLSGVSTSTAGFIGIAEMGPVKGLPTLVTSLNDFKRNFGSYLSDNQFGQYRYLSYAVDQFFTNGGSQAYIVRVAPEDAKAANGSNAQLNVAAKNSGSWGNGVNILITPSSKAKSYITAEVGEKLYAVKNSAGFNIGDEVNFAGEDGTEQSVIESVRDGVIGLSKALSGNVVTAEGAIPTKLLSTAEFTIQLGYGNVVEKYEHVSFNAIAANYVDKVLVKSSLVEITGLENSSVVALFESSNKVSLQLTGGLDGTQGNISPATYIGVDEGPGKRTGIQSFVDNDRISIISVPGVTDPAVQLALVAHCENLGSRFAILDIPRDKTSVQDVLEHRELFDSSYAALYNPWLQVFDPLEKRNIFVPPSGSVAGVYARSDSTRGVEKAPANEVIRGVSGLDVQYNRGEQDILNPQGVNLIRSFSGQGIRIWGARTTSSNSLWKYINIRRLFIFVEESIKQGTNWVVFEPNDERLWARVHRTIDAFLTRVWRGGALQGSSPSEAFYIDISSNTMSQDDIDNGRLICVIGIAPVKPAEFVVFRITQKTNEQ